jgi:Leucine-rich repeat (LRR) protein
MKKKINLSCLILLTAVCMFASSATAFAEGQIVMKSFDSEFAFRINNNVANFSIDWGDGTKSNSKEGYGYGSDYNRVEFFHEYTNKSSHTIVITGDNIQVFHCAFRQLMSLDVSKCTELEALNCSGSQLRNLDVNYCTKLEGLDCSENQLTSLDISKCPMLTELSCHANPLTSLSLNGVLERLSCGKTKLTSLSLYKISSTLKGLNCAGTPLRNLDISDCSLLDFLNCSETQITALDCSNCPLLKKLYCNDNSLRSLDVSNCYALTELDCHNNQLRHLDVSNCTVLEKLNVSGCTLLETLYCDYNKVRVSHNNCPALPLPNPEGTVSVNMRNSDYGNTVVTPPDFDSGFYIGADNNFRGNDYVVHRDNSYYKFAKIGKVKGLRNVIEKDRESIPYAGWTDIAAVEAGYGYIAKYRYAIRDKSRNSTMWKDRYVRIYVVREITSAEEHPAVLGAEIEYIVDEQWQ